jgi:hypothetical protein
MNQFSRNAVIHCRAKIEEVFPLLCPKREEEWIPGWKCEVIRSNSGYNEEGAIFKTTKPYGTQLYWMTLRYDIKSKIVDFLIMAPSLYVLRYKITLYKNRRGFFAINFRQMFTSISKKGDIFLKNYKKEDFSEKLKNLERLMDDYLEDKRAKGRKA